ncbi:MAG: tetratricopeptide repeat protein [Bacteroidia bacterium]|nr:tetratricopeptide repeat protein [Bacteroidia bacterium]
MRRWHSFLLLGMIYVLWGQQGNSAFKQAEGHRKKKEYQAALEKYNEAIQLEPNNAMYHFRKGEVLGHLKKYQEAIASYQKALELNPGLTAAYARMAGVYMKQKDYNAAISAYNQAYAKEQDVAKRIKFKLSAVRVLNNQGRSQEALSELSAMKAQIPQSNDELDVIYAEGETYLALGQSQQAIASFQKAYDKVKNLPPDQSAKYVFGLALAHHRAGNTKEYETYARQIENTPYGRRLKAAIARSGASYNLRLAMAYFKAGALDEAMEYINEAIKTKDRLSQVYQVQAAILTRKGRTADAAQSFLQAVANEPDEKKHAALYTKAIKLQFNAGDYAGAERTASRILEKTPNDINAMLLRAQALYLLNRYAEVIPVLEKAIPLMGQDQLRSSQAYFLMGLAARKAGQNDKAREAFEKVTHSSFKAAAKVESDKIAAR